MRWMSAVISCSQMRSALSICRPFKLQLHGNRRAQRRCLRVLEVRSVLANEFSRFSLCQINLTFSDQERNWWEQVMQQARKMESRLACSMASHCCR